MLINGDIPAFNALNQRLGLVNTVGYGDKAVSYTHLALTSRRVPCKPSAIPDGWHSPASSASSITKMCIRDSRKSVCITSN